MLTPVLLVLIAIAAYLLGSVNGAIIVSRYLFHSDVRMMGSGNAGLTNFYRNYGAKGIAGVLGIDIAKGALAPLIGGLVFGLATSDPLLEQEYLRVGRLFATFCLVLGHVFPVFYGFRGGKGILVSAGVILVLNYRVLLILLVVFLVVFLASRMVSLGSITVAALYPILTLADGLIRQTGTVIPDTVVGILWGGMVIFLHRENIKRLLNGTESKFGKKK